VIHEGTYIVYQHYPDTHEFVTRTADL